MYSTEHTDSRDHVSLHGMHSLLHVPIAVEFPYTPHDWQMMAPVVASESVMQRPPAPP